jgi:hypothetical protein
MRQLLVKMSPKVAHICTPLVCEGVIPFHLVQAKTRRMLEVLTLGREE